MHVDVAIIGGGPAGAAAAIVLARSGVRTAVIERSDYSASRIGETLPPAIRSVLHTLGVWETFVGAGHVESLSIRSSWGSSTPHDNEHLCNPFGSGWHVDRCRFDRMLADEAMRSGALVFMRSDVAQLRREGCAWRLDLQQETRNEEVTARVLIDAAGRPRVRPAGFARTTRVADRLIGSVRFLEGIDTPYALVEAASEGWWYSAPVPDGRLVVAYMTDADLYARDGKDHGCAWQRRLDETTATRARIVPHAIAGRGTVVSAASLFRQPGYGDGWLAAGDAAASYDPLSGQGLYNAMEGGIRAAMAVTAELDGHRDAIGEYWQSLSAQFRAYLETRQQVYAREQRWPASSFWQRRHQAFSD